MTGKHEPWWEWNWDRTQVPNMPLQFNEVVRWRFGWITVYKLVQVDDTWWWLYLPFNLGLGFSLPN